MRLCVVGDDVRMRFFTHLALARGHAAQSISPGDAPKECDVCVLPLPDSSSTLCALAPRLPKCAALCVGRLNAESAHIASGFRLLRPLADAAFQTDNALPSAEGAVYAVMSRMADTLAGSRCLVLGYGALGRALAQLLRGMGARVCVCARRRESRLAAAQAGAEARAFAELPSLLQKTDIVFNTVPAPVLDAPLLLLLPQSALVIELASAPFGVDMDACARCGLTAWREGGIPARYAPMAAARALLDFVEAEAMP